MDRAKAEGLDLLAPYNEARKQEEKEPWPRSPRQKRRRIETVVGQLVEGVGYKGPVAPKTSRFLCASSSAATPSSSTSVSGSICHRCASRSS